MNQEQQPGFTNKDGFNVLLAVATAHAATLTPFIRKGAGVQGKREGLGLLLLVLAIGFTGAPAFWGLLIAWMFIVPLRRAEAAKMRAKGWRATSNYDGWPILADWFKVKESTAKTVLEPVLCAVLGIALAALADSWQIPQLYALAGWIGLGFLTMTFECGVWEALQQKRVQAMQDAQIEQENLAERFRENDGR